jgi:hypothetical protein
MNIEIAVVIGAMFVAGALGRLAYERRMDVLYGPYIEGRSTERVLPMIPKPLQPIADRLRFKLAA